LELQLSNSCGMCTGGPSVFPSWGSYDAKPRTEARSKNLVPGKVCAHGHSRCRQPTTGPDLIGGYAVLAAVKTTLRRLRRWPTASSDSRSARRVVNLRPGRRNGAPTEHRNISDGA
jgi:hypothetical protein